GAAEVVADGDGTAGIAAREPVGGSTGVAPVTWARVLREAQWGARSGRLRSVGGRAVRGALRRGRGTSIDPPGGVLPDAVGRVLRRPRVTTRDRVALRRQPIAAHLPGDRSEQRHTRSFEYEQHAPALAGGSVLAGVRVGAEGGGGAQAAPGEDHRGGLDDAGSERGDEVAGAARHQRRLEDVGETA